MFNEMAITQKLCIFVDFVHSVKFMIFQSLRFYVKSILGIMEVQNMNLFLTKVHRVCVIVKHTLALLA